MAEVIDFLSPVGRLVQGHPMEGQTKDSKGVPYTIKTGQNAGQPTTKYFVALAIPKNSPEWPEFYAKLDQAARSGYPQFFQGPVGADGRPTCSHPRMTYKVSDGDGIDSNGKPNNQKPGWAGCWVVKFASNFKPRSFNYGKYDPTQEITDPNAIKRGWWCRVGGTIEANIGSDVPGVYVNLGMFELTSTQGDIIVSGPDASEVFSRAAPALPPGVVAGNHHAPSLPGAGGAPAGMPGLPGAAAPVTALPGMGAPAGMPGMPGAAVPPAAGLPAGMPAAGMPALPGTSGAAVQPNQGFVHGAIGGAVPGAVAMLGMPALPAQPAVAAQPVYQMTPASQGFTREQFLAQGYTDQALIDNGFMVRTA